jgi:hypothetical protein
MSEETVREELLLIFEAMREVPEYSYGKAVAAQVQGLLRCAATHLGLAPLPGISLGIGCNRVHPGCDGCPALMPKRKCRGRPEYTQGADGKPLPGQLTMFPPDWHPATPTPGFFTSPQPAPATPTP